MSVLLLFCGCIFLFWLWLLLWKGSLGKDEENVVGLLCEVFGVVLFFVVEVCVWEFRGW